MANARSTLALLLLLVWMGAPALRCLVPGEALTASEQACCKAMAGHCGDSTMAHHSCCKTATSTAQPMVASGQASGGAFVPASVAIPKLVYPERKTNFAGDWLLDPSPPPHLEQTSPILRI